MRTLWNVVGAVLVAALAVCFADSAFAQSCVPEWSILGSPFTGTQTEACAESAVRFAPYGPGGGVSVTSCTLAGSTLHAALHYDTGADFDVTSTQTLACAAEPPASGASDPASSDFTSLQTNNLLVWGFLVLLFGTGYVGGRLR